MTLLQCKGWLLTFDARMATPDTPTTAAKAMAWPRPILPEGNGRLMVRFMRESLWTSYTCRQARSDRSVDAWGSVATTHSNRCWEPHLSNQGAVLLVTQVLTSAVPAAPFAMLRHMPRAESEAPGTCAMPAALPLERLDAPAESFEAACAVTADAGLVLSPMG